MVIKFRLSHIWPIGKLWLWYIAFYSISDSVTLSTYIRNLMNILMFFFYEKPGFPPMYKSSTMCQNVYPTYAKVSGKTKGCATCSRSKLVPGRCAHTQDKCIRAWISALLQVCLHEAEVTRTSQKHAVRCDMYIHPKSCMPVVYG